MQLLGSWIEEARDGAVTVRMTVELVWMRRLIRWTRRRWRWRAGARRLGRSHGWFLL